MIISTDLIKYLLGRYITIIPTDLMKYLVGRYIMIIPTDLMKYSLYDNYKYGVGAKVCRYILQTWTESILNKQFPNIKH